MDTTIPPLSRYFDTADPAIQPWTSIVNAGPELRTVRLIGTALVNFFGRDPTGQIWRVVGADAVPMYQRAYAEIPTVPCGAFLRGECSTSQARVLEMDGIGLPYGTREGPCIMWYLQAGSSLGLAEAGVQIQRVHAADWIDLGYGVPKTKLM
jgi:hypothetical protein